MKMYVTAKFKGDENKADIEALCAVVRAAGFEDVCFIRDVENYTRGVFENPQELMDRARVELLKCDALLIDMTEGSSGGRLLEAGMAYGLKKLVVVIAKEGTKLSMPVAGLTGHVIYYEVLDDIAEPLRSIARRHKLPK